ncbi:MAG: hypothetical protein HZA37_02635 [Parcubacteria group bacterium]|nr:hypothetical protein [Parcubacteria group bacterium]
MGNPVRKTAFWVARQAKNAKINREKINALAAKWAAGDLRVPPWPKKMHLETKNKKALLDYLILLDSLNFCFWSKKERWLFIYRGRTYNGYFALSLALKKFFEENPEKGSIDYFPEISFKEFKAILGGGKGLLFLRERWRIARAVSRILLKKYGGVEKFILSVGGRLSVLVPKIAGELFSFNDVVRYRGKKVYLWKRAQITAADIWGAFGGRGIGHFQDLDYLTAFADYKLPQILYFWGILEYSEKLKNKIERRTIIPAGSEEEIEIRAATVAAVELLRKELAQRGKRLYPFQVDWILWDKSQRIKMKSPYHLTKTWFY